MKVRRTLSETLNRWSSVEVFHKTDFAACMQQTSQTVQDFIIQDNLSKFLSQTPSWKRGFSISSWPAQNLQRDGVIILQNYNLLPHIWPESILHTTTPAYWRTITTHIPQTTNRQHEAIFKMKDHLVSVVTDRSPLIQRPVHWEAWRPCVFLKKRTRTTVTNSQDPFPNHQMLAAKRQIRDQTLTRQNSGDDLAPEHKKTPS